MSPATAQRKITKAFAAAEVAYVAIEDVAREYTLPAELVQEVVDAQTAWHRSVKRLRQHVDTQHTRPAGAGEGAES